MKRTELTIDGYVGRFLTTDRRTTRIDRKRKDQKKFWKRSFLSRSPEGARSSRS